MRGALITLFMTRVTVLDQASKSIDSWQRGQRARGRKTSSSTLFTSHLHESFLNELKVAYRDKRLPFWLPNCLCTSSSIVYFFYFKTPSFGRMPPFPSQKKSGGGARHSNIPALTTAEAGTRFSDRVQRPHGLDSAASRVTLRRAVSQLMTSR